MVSSFVHFYYIQQVHRANASDIGQIIPVNGGANI